MSYHLNMEQKGKAPDIEMPPLPQEPVQEVVQEQPEVEQPEPVKEVEQAAEPVKETEIKVSEVNENNIRKLRENAKRVEQIERERDELLRKLQEVEASKTQPKQVQEEPEDINLADDDLLEAKHLKIYTKKYENRIKQLEEKLNNVTQQSNLASVDTRLKQRFPDIDKVLSKDNLEVLKQEYPELADSVNATQDIYNKAVSAYTLIKKLGITQEDTFQEDKQKAQINAAKPRPLVSVSPQQGDSPLSHANAFANGLTDDLKAQLRKEMEDARKNI